MNVKQFAELALYGERVQVESAYNGKILCKNFKAEKHKDIGEREVSSVYSAISIGFHKNYATSYLRVMVRGDVEYRAEHEEEDKT